MNYSVLIADDEEIERRALKLLLERSFPSLAVSADSANGDELLRDAEALKPDIILADIEMPGMNGLQALARLRENGCDARVIIITAYSSYQYAKESVSLHAFEFLEKPAKRDRVIAVMEKAIADIDVDRGRREETEKMRRFIEQMSGVIRSEFMMTIEMDEGSCGQMERYIDMLDMRFERGYIMTFLARAASRASIQESVSELRVFERVRSAIQGGGRIDGHVFNHRLACFVPVQKADTPYMMKADALKLAGDILDALPGEMRECVRVGIGRVVDAPDKLNASYRESIGALHAQGSADAICHYGDIVSAARADDPFRDAEGTILDAIRSQDREGCFKAAKALFMRVSREMELKELQDRAVESVLLIRRQMDSLLERRLAEFRSAQTAFNEVWRMNGADELGEWYIKTCVGFIDAIKRQGISWQKLVIERAKAYILEHYNRDISLEETAEAIGVSQYYLSRLFKANAGVNYSAYITELRIRRAAQLLERYDLSARELAQRVGFNDSDYFGKVFKKVMGCTVSDFRAMKHR